jgi:hypothetical protein
VWWGSVWRTSYAATPADDGVGSYEKGNLGEGLSADGLTPHGESAALIVGEPESSATERLLEDAILLAQIVQ